MTITLGAFEFDNVFYDADADVLYLHKGEPASAVDFDESPEGHALRFDAEGKLIGVTVLNAKRGLERDGELKVTVPEVVRADADALAPALALGS
jgi:uncharacterized protein YuzE